MPFNLITEAWIPVRTATGPARIRPDQIADPSVRFPDWARPDFNIACLELLIGLVALADPPRDQEDWAARRAPDPARLRAGLLAVAPAFDLDGDGPRFLQDFDALQGEPRPTDMLFIDSAGENTIRKNADLMVKRGRYGPLDPATAALALFTLQAFAPSGGAGNRTSLRAGGPMVALVEPAHGCGLWDLVWANVPFMASGDIRDLPWMSPTITSEGDRTKFPPATDGVPIETLFGMPRRLRLVFGNGRVTGVIQVKHGTLYEGWKHPLTPYYRKDANSLWLARRPRPGISGYRNWLGVAVDGEVSDHRERSACVTSYSGRVSRREARASRILVAGWAMDNMSPLDFTLAHAPLLDLGADQSLRLRGMIEAAGIFEEALRTALVLPLGAGAGARAAGEEFYARTQPRLEAQISILLDGREADPHRWKNDCRRAALDIFDAAALPGLATGSLTSGDPRRRSVEEIVQARSRLCDVFSGYGAGGRAAFQKLMIDPPNHTKKESVA